MSASWSWAPIVIDGGCVSSGDVAKAFGGGADFYNVGWYVI